MQLIWRDRILASVLAITCLGCRPDRPNPPNRTAPVLTVGAAASLRESVAAIADEFERETGAVVQISLAASGTLQRQVEQHAPIDVLLSADERSLDALAEDAMIDTASRITIARNCLVAIVPQTSPMRTGRLADLAHVGTVAIGNPKTVPAGRYARAALQRAQIYDGLHTSNRLIFGEHVRQVLTYVERGIVDAAIVYETDAAIASDVAIAARIPTDWTPPITYSGAVTTRSAESDQSKTAHNFLTFLQSDAARNIFQRYGFRSNRDQPNCEVASSPRENPDQISK